MFYKVASIQAAWEKAKEIFPSDYQKDESSTGAAGYPIYFSTVEGSNDHISDLGCRLEVNRTSAPNLSTSGLKNHMRRRSWKRHRRKSRS